MRTFNAFLGALATLAVLVSPAAAADLYNSNGSTKDPITGAIASPIWTGFYVGANIGWADAWSRDALSAPEVGPGSGLTVSTSPVNQASASGVFGGAQGGYLFQHGNFVFGIEADIHAADVAGSASTDISSLTFANNGVPIGTIALPAGTLLVESKQSIDWFGTVRPRLGFAVDKFLIYGTGGLAYGNVKDELSGVLSLGGSSISGGVSHEETRIGWVVGGGVGYKIGNWSAEAEYLHVDLGSAAINEPLFISGVNVGTVHTRSIPSDVDTFTAKLNYHLN